MTYTIRISATSSDADITFPCEGNEAVLDAAERAGFSLPYSCRKGVCTSCAGELVSGEATELGREVHGPAKDVLFCRARPTSDLVIAPRSIARRGIPARKRLRAEVYRVLRPSSDVTILQLRYPIGTRAAFRAGQYLRVLFPDGDSRNYSLANDPARNDGAELHIRHVPGGRFSCEVLSKLSVGGALEVEVPFGQFVLEEDSGRPLVMLATGTGFAPLQAMVLDQIRRRATRPVTLYWGARRCEELYALPLAGEWAARFPWFSFIPVLSRPDAGWAGRAGWVHNALLEDRLDLSGCEIYACGNPAMTADAARELAARGGLSAAAYHCDAFVPSGEPAAAQKDDGRRA
jgi:CDP-4-dehydro-6-deoxyglucose reductase/3-phenylpropionate/trans-cinnamate dioxygenase ferredoxin reductase subunit